MMASHFTGGLRVENVMKTCIDQRVVTDAASARIATAQRHPRICVTSTVKSAPFVLAIARPTPRCSTSQRTSGSGPSYGCLAVPPTTTNGAQLAG
jgi:hypothetical protein